MRLVLTALIFAQGLLFLVLGLQFLFMPADAAVGFGLTPDGPMGLAVLRADFPAIFFVGGGAMLWGAWKRNGDVLLIPAAIFGIALLGRCVSVVVDGTTPGFWFPMSVEAVAVLLTLVASRVLPHRMT